MPNSQPTRRQLLKGAGAVALGGGALAQRSSEPASQQESLDKAEQKHPNLLFIIDDQHRWDVLGASGNRFAHTPAIDRLAGQGTRFTDVYCQVPLCVPARQSMLTGTYAHQHTSFGNVALDFPEEQATIAQHLRSFGYQTAMIGKSHFNDKDFESVMEKSAIFREFESAFPGAVHPGPHALKGSPDTFPNPVHSANPHYLEAAAREGETVFRMEEDVVRRSEDYLDNLDNLDPTRPFFLWASLVNPHPPRFPPKRWLDLFREVDIPLPKALTKETHDALFSYHRALIQSTGMSRVSEEEMRNMVRAYYASVAWADHNIGAMIKALDSRGPAENTLLVFTSDHGECLGEHGMVGKVSFFEGPERVPLVMRRPGQLRAGAVVERVVTHLDLMATLPELLGLPAFPPARGRSMLPLLSGAADAQWEDLAIAELYLGAKDFTTVPGELLSVMLRKDSLKYFEGTQNEAVLYDLSEDPDEEHNLIADAKHKGTLAEIRERVRLHKPEEFFARVQKRRGRKRPK